MKKLTLALCVIALLGSGASGYLWWQIGDSKQDLTQQLQAEQARTAGLTQQLSDANQRGDTLAADLRKR